MMETVMIHGPEGRIEGKYHVSGTQRPVALVLHPHPQQGGNMNNKVTYGIFRAFAKMGFNVLRFNFRGTGNSEGSFAQGEGELIDAATCLNWLHSKNPDPVPYWIAGFSFGAWVAMQLLMRRPEISGFISVSPPANLYDFSFLAPCPVSGLIIQGDQDNIVTKESAMRLAHRLSMQRGIQVDFAPIRGAGHFFDNQIDELTHELQTYVQASMDQQKKNSTQEK